MVWFLETCVTAGPCSVVDLFLRIQPCEKESSDVVGLLVKFTGFCINNRNFHSNKNAFLLILFILSSSRLIFDNKAV